jgi:hypothetical protein
MWADRATVSPGTVYRRLSAGASIPIRQTEASSPSGLSFRDVVETVLFMLPQAACYYCGAPSGRQRLEIDHAIPLVRGGEERSENRLPACRSCNQAKYDRTYEGSRLEMAGEYETEPPTFFGETDFARRVVRYRFDPNDLPEKLRGRPIRDPDRDANRMETNTSRHLGL